MDLPPDFRSTDGAATGRRDRRRVIVYANEMVGLGHLRRTLAIVQRLPDASSLVLTGSSIEPFFPLPPRCDTVKLPSRSRDADGRPCSRLDLDLDDLHRLRGRIALAAAEAFQPDVALVDKLPLGLGGELEPTLLALRRAGCRLVLGLRDVDDSPANVQHKWDARTRDAVRRHYDLVLVYGPSCTPDAIDCLGWDDLDVPVLHVGYISAATRAVTTPPDDLEPGYLLATAGGGHDGYRLLATLAQAIRRDPPPCRVVMVAGPLLAPEAVGRLRALVAGLPVELFEFRTDMDRVLAGARAVVSMAGYNTVAESVRAGLPALLVPRVRPSEEQLVRARLLAATGAQDMLHPDDLSPATLRAALDRLLARPRFVPDLSEHQGAERAAEHLSELAPAPSVPLVRRRAKRLVRAVRAANA